MASSSKAKARKSCKVAVVNSPNLIPALPSEILEEFLSRLPLRSLIYSSIVCKSWYALLKNPNFASKHFQHAVSSSSSSYFLFRRHHKSRRTGRGTVSFVSGTESFHINNTPFLEQSKLMEISGSCNGLVCLTLKPTTSIIILWNPITRVYKDLPFSPVKRPPMIKPCSAVLGFGFDSVSRDFKLLRIVNYQSLNHQQAELYSVGSNSWREIQSHAKFRVQDDSSRAIVNGRFHWAACETDTGFNPDIIATFDISNEVFGCIKLPNIIAFYQLEEYVGGELVVYYRKTRWKLVVWKEDFLGLIVYQTMTNAGHYDMWVLDVYGVEESWTKHFSFGHGTTLHYPLACKSNGEILLYKNGNQLVVYDSVTHTFKDILSGHRVIFSAAGVFNFVGSLLPIEGGRTVEEANLEAVVPDPFFVV